MTAPPQAPAPTAPRRRPGIDAAIPQLVGVLQQLGRNDLADRANAAGARLRRPATVVCVVGEFKQGKSSLVNGLLGRDACPVDDDSPPPRSRSSATPTSPRPQCDGASTVSRSPSRSTIDDLADLGDREQATPANERGVERVEIAVPSAILKQGLVLVDTPGMGGPRRRPRRGDARVPAVRRRVDPRVGRVGGAQRARGRVPRPRVGAVPDGAVRADEDRPLPVSGRASSTSTAATSSAAACASRPWSRSSASAPRGARPQGPRPQRALAVPRADQGARRGRGHAREGARSGTLDRRRACHRVGRAHRPRARSSGCSADPNAAAEALAELEQAKTRLEYLRGPGREVEHVVVGDRVADISNDITYQFRAGDAQGLRPDGRADRER